MTRRSFFAKLRSLGFSKSFMQMTRMGITYEFMDERGRISVSVPKHHENTFFILGSLADTLSINGIYSSGDVSWADNFTGDGLSYCYSLCEKVKE